MSKAKKPTEVIEEVNAEVAVETEVAEIPEVAVETEVAEAAPESIIKSGFRKVRTPQFRGSYRDTFFNDDCIAERISEETLTAWKAEFPNAVIEEIE